MQAKMRHQEWMSRKTRRRTENRGGQFVPMFDKGSHQGYPAKAIFAQGALRVIEITFQNESRAVVERMVDQAAAGEEPDVSARPPGAFTLLWSTLVERVRQRVHHRSTPQLGNHRRQRGD